MKNRVDIEVYSQLLNRVLAANCLNRQISIGFAMHGRKVLGKITYDNFNLSHHLDVERSFDFCEG